MVPLSPSFSVFSESFSGPGSKWPVYGKKLAVKQKGAGSWVLGVIVTSIWCIFDILVFSVILGSFGALVAK